MHPWPLKCLLLPLCCSQHTGCSSSVGTEFPTELPRGSCHLFPQMGSLSMVGSESNSRAPAAQLPHRGIVGWSSDRAVLGRKRHCHGLGYAATWVPEKPRLSRSMATADADRICPDFKSQIPSWCPEPMLGGRGWEGVTAGGPQPSPPCSSSTLWSHWAIVTLCKEGTRLR